MGARPVPLPSCHVRATTTPLLDDLVARLPRGYRGRAFDDADREPIVAAGNSEAHPMEEESADEWRHWEAMVDDPQRQRVTITTDDGTIVGTANIAAGMMPRSDGAQFVGMSVFKAHRRKGIGSAIFTALEAEAIRRRVPRVLAGASAAKPLSLERSEEHTSELQSQSNLVCRLLL